MTDLDSQLDPDTIEWFNGLNEVEQAEFIELLEEAVGEQWALAPKQEYAEALWHKVDWMLYGGAAGGGKMLALATKVATPDGWTTMGDLQAGDRIFTETGEQTTVLIAHPIDASPQSFRLTFDDGSVIEACADHLWWTYTNSDLQGLSRADDEWRERRRANRPSRVSGKKSAKFAAALSARNSERAMAGPRWGAIRSTEEIAKTLTVRGRSNHVVPVCDAVELPDADLPIDPYVFGAWLGDGSRDGGRFTGVDEQIWREIESAGFTVTHSASDPQAHYITKLTPLLKALGAYKNKHVPPMYLRGSIKQRLALLQGLMDTDGHACETGAVEFTNTNKRLAEAVVEVARSLGHKCRMTEGRATLNGRDCGPKYRIKWTPPDVVFRLERKVCQQRVVGIKRSTRYRTIVTCDPIDPTPMRCITVDNPTGLYLVGDSFVPTHNTELMIKHANDLSERVPTHSTLVVRQSIPELRRSIILRLKARIVQFRIGARLRKVDGVSSFQYLNDSLIECGYLATDEHVANYLSAEYDLILIDEASLMTSNQIILLASRLRTTKRKAAMGARPHLGLFSNPGGASHAWLYEVFVSSTDHGKRVVVLDISQGVEKAQIVRFYEAPIDPNGATDEQLRDVLVPWAESLVVELDPRNELAVAFIPAKASDNPYVAPGYMKYLNALPERRRRQLRDGDWDTFEGQYFHEWNRDIHIVPWFEIPEGWTHARGLDFGSAAPWACLFGAWDNDGNCYLYDECYGAGFTPAEQARMAKEKQNYPLANGKTRKINYFDSLADPSVFADKRGTGKSIADLWRDNGLHVTRAKNARVAGWQNMRHYLWDDERKTPRLFVLDGTCPNFVRCMPLQQHDKKHPEDLDTTLEEHVIDAARYLLLARPIGTRVPKPKDGLTIEQRFQRTLGRALDRRPRARLFR